MNGNLKIHLKANECIFVNGAALKVDRKVSLELLNNVAFLLEAHVLKPEDAKSPLRRLYLNIQTILMEPSSRSSSLQAYHDLHGHLISTVKEQDILEALVEIKDLIGRDRIFEALKKLRSLFPLEDEMLATASTGAYPMEQTAE